MLHVDAALRFRQEDAVGRSRHDPVQIGVGEP